MKTRNYINTKITLLTGFILMSLASCDRDLAIDDVATFTATAEIFTDAPVGMGSNFYFPYGPEPTNPVGSKLTAWSVDSEVSYIGSASMRFDVPSATDPDGNYAGATFLIDGSGRDLSGYDALTFWAKASQGATVNEIGFGEGETVVILQNVELSTAWTKYIIPIPDASKLLEEKGMLRYAAAGINGLGYTFWIDELKFEKLGTIAQVRPFIQGATAATGVGFESQQLSITNIGVTSNLPNGRDVTVVASPSYFEFESSDSSIASVNGTQVTLNNSGTATITAKLNDIDALGSLTISSTALAPTPTVDASDVIALFSDAYTNSPVDFFNGYWAPWQNTQGQDDIDINGNKMIKYTELNFVGIEFQGAKTVDASSMTHFHIDILVENAISAQDFLEIKIVDFGADKSFAAPNSEGIYKLVPNPSASNEGQLTNGNWMSLDIPLSSFNGLTATSNLAQIVFVSEGSNNANPSSITDIYVDNIYFHK